MKVGVLSDSHGSFTLTKKAVEHLKAEKVSLIVHLGDVLYHGPRNPIPPFYDPSKLAGFLKGVENLVILKGNCDSDVDETVIGRGFSRSMVLATGDGFLASFSHIEEDAVGLPGNLVLYGHTHIPDVKREGNRLLVNPGSVSLPKEGNPPTFLVLDLDRKVGTFVSVEGLNAIRMFPLTV